MYILIYRRVRLWGGEIKIFNSVYIWGYIFRVVFVRLVKGVVEVRMLGDSRVFEREFIGEGEEVWF